MIKARELSSPTSCLNKAGSDEPIFVFRATDKNAPAAIRFWAQQYHRSKTEIQGRLTTTQIQKHSEALALANEMELWSLEQAERKRIEDRAKSTVRA